MCELPNLVVFNLLVCNVSAETFFFRSLAPFCALSRTCVYALLRSFVSFLRLMAVGTTSFWNLSAFSNHTFRGSSRDLS